MKHISCRIIVCLLAFIVFFSSCDYDAKSLPDFKPDYSVAFPLGDTAFSIRKILDPILDLENFPIIDDNFVIRPMVLFNETVSYTVYMQDLQSENYLMEWLEPKFIITNGCPSAFNVIISVYLQAKDNDRYYLINNFNLITGKQILMGTVESRIDISKYSNFYNTEEIVLELYIELKEPTTFGEMKNSSVDIQIAAKAKISENLFQ